MTISSDYKDSIASMSELGLSSRQIASKLGVSKSTVNNYLSKERVDETPQMVLEVPEMDTDLDTLCVSDDLDVANLAKRLRNAQKENTRLRRSGFQGYEIESQFDAMQEAVSLATERLTGCGIVTTELAGKSDGNTSAIAEILFSDFQIGKVGQYYNSQRAEMAIKRYGDEVLDRLGLASLDYNLEKIIVASLGDIVEDHMKHGIQSATSTDCGLSEQMALAIEYMWKHIIAPLGELDIPMEIICIAGNHGSSQHKGMDMFKAGLYSYDYTIYKALEGFCKVAGYEHIKFIIPEGCFGYTTIYGRSVVYEHGYFNSCTEKSMDDQRNKRGSQLKRHVEYFRCGDMHHVCNYDNGKLVVNGAFFGTDTEGVEYSGIIGFSAVPAQVMMIHTDQSSVGRNTVTETHIIQVADGY